MLENQNCTGLKFLSKVCSKFRTQINYTNIIVELKEIIVIVSSALETPKSMQLVSIYEY